MLHYCSLYDSFTAGEIYSQVEFNFFNLRKFPPLRTHGVTSNYSNTVTEAYTVNTQRQVIKVITTLSYPHWLHPVQ